ncbi:TonB-dependent receptor [Parahaliea aestuarii]|uniref:TonB-dependent receptor n=1 Tax=Parahaliea aestuarii TaxID=1852021 RepID=A0A5C8ZVB6_9GAMM|nr:TonB-dependent receptor [Parahaliea aestuarii]TXS91522.1 TonB-dependent receptor [Parahaliea aestuarii]
MNGIHTCPVRIIASSLALAAAALPATLAQAQSNRATALEEVVVTAQRREQDLQRTSVSVTALGGELLADADLPELSSLENLVPNLNFRIGSDGGNSTLQAFIRGVGQFDFAITTDPGVGMYIDNVYQSRTIGANLEFADIEQVQVLRGPQGTLYGKNTIGGAINVVTKKPGDELEFQLEGATGSYQHRELNGYLSVPLIDGTLAASAAFLMRESDGWQERRGQDAGNDDMAGGRFHLLWTPGESFESHLVLDAAHQRQNVYPRVLATFNGAEFFPFLYNTFVSPGDPCCTPNADIDKSNALNELERDDLDSRGASWTNTWSWDKFQLQSITGYRQLESEIYRDSDNDPQDFLSVGTLIDGDQISQEFIFSGLALNDNLDWVAGLYYLDEDAEHDSDITVASGLFEALSSQPLDVTLPDGTPVAFLAVPLDLTLHYERQQQTTSYAAYIHGIYSLSDSLRLTLAARYTDEEKELDTFSVRRASQTAFVTPGPTDASACSDVVASGNGSRYQCKESWSEVSPKVGIEWDINDDIMTYLSASRGFRSGAFNGRPTALAEISVADPETLTAYEWGLKSEWWDRRLIVNGALFYNDYEDQQFLVNRSSASLGGGLALIVDNAGDSSITGAELEISALPVEGLTLTGTLGWIDAEFDTFESINPATGQVEDLSDRPFQDTPEWTGSLMAQYEWIFNRGGSLKLLADVYYKDNVYYTNDRAARDFEVLHPDGFTTWNAGLIYTTPQEHWQVALHGRNLGDEREINGGFTVDAFGVTDVSYTAPRRYFLSLRYRL